MTLPVLTATNSCCNQPGSRAPLFATICDVLGFITFLVMGVLGATSVIAMSPAAAYSMIGISCAIALSWVAMIVYISNKP